MGMFFQVHIEAKLFRPNGFPHKDTHFHFHKLNAHLLLVVWNNMVEAEETNITLGWVLLLKGISSMYNLLANYKY